MPGIVIELIGDEKSYLRAAQNTLSVNTKLDASFKQVGVNANLSAQAQITAGAKAIRAQEAQLASLQAARSRLVAGSTEWIAANVAIARSEESLNRATGATIKTESAFMKARAALGFAGVGFVAAAGGAEVIRQSILAAEDLEAAQRSLDVAIAHTGGNVEELGAQYLATAKAAARFGVDQVEATRGLARATVLTGDAAAAQRAYEEALVISKATGKEFSVVLTATSKAQEGIVTSLRRYGILVDKTSTGQEQFNLVMRRFGGQADANTTSTQRLEAAFHNLGTALGTTVLPAFAGVVDGLAEILNKMQEINDFKGHASKKLGPFGFLIDSLPKLLNDEIDRARKTMDFLSGASTPAPGVRLPGGLRGPTGPGSFSGPLGVLGPTGSADAGAAKALAAWQLHITEQIAQANAALTRSTDDDVAAAKRIVARIKRDIDRGHLHGTRLIQALQAEASALGVIWSAEDAAAEKRAEAAQAAKERIAAQLQDSIDPLRLEVMLSKAQALGKDTTAILKRLRSAAEKALRSGKLSLEQQREAWDQIASINQQLADQANATAKGLKQANTRLLTAGLHLSAAQRAELRARLSHLDASGRVNGDGVGAFGFEIGRNGRPIHVHTHLNLDGKPVTEVVTKHQQRHRRRNSSQRRGPNAGT